MTSIMPLTPLTPRTPLTRSGRRSRRADIPGVEDAARQLQLCGGLAAGEEHLARHAVRPLFAEVAREHRHRGVALALPAASALHRIPFSAQLSRRFVLETT